MLNKLAAILVALTFTSCVIAIAIGEVFFYVLCFIMLTAAVIFGLLVIAINITWKFLSNDLKKSYEGKRVCFNTKIFLIAILFPLFILLVDGYCLRNAVDILSLIGKIMTVTFVVFSGWCLIKRNKGKTILAGSIVFILLIIALSIIGSNILTSSEIRESGSIEKLKSLGYVAWVPAKDSVDKVGVTAFDPNLAFDGFNIYNSHNLTEVYLIDMQGNVVNKWTRKDCGDNWGHYSELCRNGDLLVIGVDQMLVRLDWESKIKWKTNMRVHHDVCVAEKENIYAIAREDKLVFWHGIVVPILSDYIAVLSPDGKVIEKVWIYDQVKRHISLKTIVGIYKGLFRLEELEIMYNSNKKENYTCRRDSVFDIFHTNTIEIMNRDIEGFCREGDYLISIREMDFIGVLDSKTKKVVWFWGSGELDRQHYPTLMENGNVLVYDNGFHRGFTRIVELNPLTKKIEWEYKSVPQEDFFSKYRGCGQWLPNGNILITESSKGRVFEITREGKIVWEFYNPVTWPGKNRRLSIYRMIRTANSVVYKNLGKDR